MASTPLTAVAKVLSTFELIENILLFLPLRQLLLAKRINKATFDVISGSSNIRGALFLKASGAPLQVFEIEPESKLILAAGVGWREREEAKNVRPIVNPFLKLFTIDLGRTQDRVQQALSGERAILFASEAGDIDGYACRRERPGVTLAVESRDKMLMTHPPVGKLELEDKDDTHETVIGSDKGTTLGELFQYGSSTWKGKYRGLLKEVKRGTSKCEEVAPAVYFLDQAASWKRLDGGVHGITGHEMLAIFNAEPEELNTDESESEDGSEDFSYWDDIDREYYDYDDAWYSDGEDEDDIYD